VLIRSDKASGLDKSFNSAKAEFGSNAKFIRLEWSSDDGERASAQFSIQSPPALVLTDARGKVVAKQEGAQEAVAIFTKLRSLAK